VVLKPSDTAELIEKLEDSQMQLGSMATNRWGHGGPTGGGRT
jgi:dynein heavy chain